MNIWKIILTVLCSVSVIGKSMAQIQLMGFQILADDGDSLTDASLGKQLADGSSVIFADQPVTLRLFGSGLQNGTMLCFTKQPASSGDSCALMPTTKRYTISAGEAGTVTVSIELEMLTSNDRYYFCISDQVNNLTDFPRFTHQGDSSWLRIATKTPYVKHYLLPLPVQIIIILLLLLFSALFSGLNLGLMSLDKTELDIMINSGTKNEKKYAKKIRPLRKRGNFLLCTILLGNVMVNNTLTILTDDVTGSGLSAIIAATLAIVIFGEIIPQAVCSRYGLAIGARTAWFTRIFMIITFPLSYPISRILDCILGQEIGNVYNRDRLKALLRLTENQIDLEKDELNIITGALELSKKTVLDVMTKLEDVFMIEINSVLDFDTMNLIMKTGYTRIPIYEKEKSNIIALLNIKDLAFIDPDDRTPLKTVTQFYKHPVKFVFEDLRLDLMLEEFKNGRSHLAVVQRVNSDGPLDPFYEIIGLVTLEDIIEEIFQFEIIDESDTVYDNRKKAPRLGNDYVKDFSVFNQPDQNNYIRLSPQLALAAFQFLSTSVEPFKSELISESILQKLLRQNVIVNLRLDEKNSEDSFLYRCGKQCDFFIMILQGRVRVTFGKELLMFEAGPFVYFGTQALSVSSMNQSTQSLSRRVSQTSFHSGLNDQGGPSSLPYVSDVTVQATSDLQYLCIKRAHYLIARRATLMERQPRPDGISEIGMNGRSASDQFERDWKRTALGIPGSAELNTSNSFSKSPTGSNRSTEDKVLNFTGRSRAVSESTNMDSDRTMGGLGKVQQSLMQSNLSNAESNDSNRL